jgi:CopG family transcriptional regulator/antitoxin EndoAI
MCESKKILISLPVSLLDEIDSMAEADKMNRSEFAREAFKRYIEEKKKVRLREELISGYSEIGAINVEIAESCLESDSIQLEDYEKRLQFLKGEEG